MTSSQPVHAPPRAGGVVVAIPVRNEADKIAACLAAFARQDFDGVFDLLFLLNNCTDATAGIIADFPASRMRVHVETRVFPPHLANAGHARRVAMLAARRLAGPHGVLLSTDADSTVAPDWIRRNIEIIADGADAVAGRIEMDPEDFARLPPRLHDDEARAQTLARLIDAIDATADPVVHDPWPRHAEHSGASIAVTCAAHDAAGGIPRMPSSEDRAFFAALRGIDARIRHAPEVIVTVSGRLDGRAPGGMAETLRRRMAAPDEWLDDCIEPARNRLRRSRLRHSARQLRADARHGALTWRDVEGLSTELALCRGVVAGLLTDAPSFGGMWKRLEALSPRLGHCRVPARDLEAEIAVASGLLRQLTGARPVPQTAAA